MPLPLVLSLISTLVLLGMMTAFLFGSVSLLALKHDTPVHSLVVRGLFDGYYRVALVVASAAAVCYAVAGLVALAIVAAALAVLVVVLRRRVIPEMDTLHTRLKASETAAIRPFRRLLGTAILINLGALAVTLLTFARSPVNLG